MVEFSQIAQMETLGIPGNAGNETRVIRSRLLNLILDWELEALALDAKRYKTDLVEERIKLKHDSNLVRKCIAEVTEILGTPTLSK